MQLEARLGWKSDWRRCQIGTEARLAQRPDWLGSQIGWEATPPRTPRISGLKSQILKPWLKGQIGW